MSSYEPAQVTSMQQQAVTVQSDQLRWVHYDQQDLYHTV